LLRFAVLAAVVRDDFLTAVDALHFFPCAAFNRRIRLRAARAASDPPSPRGEESQATTLRKNAAGKIGRCCQL